MRAVEPAPELKGKIMAQLGLDGKVGKDPDFSFVMGPDVEEEWVDLPNPGSRIRVLSDNEADGHTIFVLELDSDTTVLAHSHQGAESAFVLSGDLEIEGRFLRAGDFSRAAPGSHHRRLSSRDGCRALLVTSYENFHVDDN